MEGAPVCSRKLNKGPRDFMPTALLVATSNHPPRVTRPDGMLRRLRVCQTTVSFTLKPSMATEERAVDGLKTRINRGEFNKYIFFLAANLVDSLEMEYNPGTKIKPQPHLGRGKERDLEGPRYISTLKQNERMVGVKLRSASSS